MRLNSAHKPPSPFRRQYLSRLCLKTNAPSLNLISAKVKPSSLAADDDGFSAAGSITSTQTPTSRATYFPGLFSYAETRVSTAGLVKLTTNATQQSWATADMGGWVGGSAEEITLSLVAGRYVYLRVTYQQDLVLQPCKLQLQSF